jgi:hypothetical protein
MRPQCEPARGRIESGPGLHAPERSLVHEGVESWASALASRWITKFAPYDLLRHDEQSRIRPCEPPPRQNPGGANGEPGKREQADEGHAKSRAADDAERSQERGGGAEYDHRDDEGSDGESSSRTEIGVGARGRDDDAAGARCEPWRSGQWFLCDDPGGGERRAPFCAICHGCA